MFASEVTITASTSTSLASSSSSASARSKISEEAGWELNKARSILCASYVYGYFHLDEHQGTKSLFELVSFKTKSCLDCFMLLKDISVANYSSDRTFSKLSV